MKRLMTSIVAFVMLIGLAGCAAMAPPDVDTRVQCPACGYEFEVPKHHN
ncbi:hypothetical protein [Geoalkalibacter halelectricus]|uniref:Lipoprotein n=1 Tax=Geoalkalibacter halelectricus TaxID=2847045 RepID=A0ABY5ZPQ3_9BACT|nr:hypothetical protein [Geoalkalibacter halelectricus]MDO3376878.1 hypothetical protein [Geoalkalibacter halelectricus]UWZ81103.1 hypothetical protein L9S41_06825 [Geoalkalibacter halelectricus]